MPARNDVLMLPWLGWLDCFSTDGIISLASASVGEGPDKRCPCYEQTVVSVDKSLVARPSVACFGFDCPQVIKLMEAPGPPVGYWYCADCQKSGPLRPSVGSAGDHVFAPLRCKSAFGAI